MIPRASDFPTEYDGACLQMRMSYSPAAHLFLFLVQWTDCSLAGALGLLRIMIYKVTCHSATQLYFLFSYINNYVYIFNFLYMRSIWYLLAIKELLHVQVHSDGSTSMSNHERKASLKEFYSRFIPLVFDDYFCCYQIYNLLVYLVIIMQL